MRPLSRLSAYYPSLFNKLGQIRCLSSSTSSSKPFYDYSLLPDKGDQKICHARQMLGFKTPPLFVIRKSSVFLYESCTDKIDIAKFFETLKLDDTFNSWFCITRWHVWMIANRCMQDKVNGKTLRNELIKRMWEDVNNRLDKLYFIKRRKKYVMIQQLYSEFNATLFGLDEGLVTNDCILAGAIWRTILGMNEEKTDPIILELLVRYTRVQTQHLSTTISPNYLLFNGNITWKNLPPLIENINDNKTTTKLA
ncbi:Ubiquinol-cytochrome-c reductase complex assembly factor 1 [Dermatophagoides pteronyssinus]|uniref:Ubiquinol-cytochrome-c reductase complex assembly factor 1 n=1 Tax=Dermatophagoides pteronyssinus TaxID=6956 RepID=A0ABQ8J331_DERPT|nr:Ubiquinol-cytochrome-c reductase complex assembly factor 1 [Dermatophagoides pteronyssinus]